MIHSSLNKADNSTRYLETTLEATVRTLYLVPGNRYPIRPKSSSSLSRSMSVVCRHRTVRLSRGNDMGHDGMPRCATFRAPTAIFCPFTSFAHATPENQDFHDEIMLFLSSIFISLDSVSGRCLPLTATLLTSRKA
jgi:hypothetical protein